MGQGSESSNEGLLNLRLIGVDVGGTFTDLVFAAGDVIKYAKVSTTPTDMHLGVKQAIEKVLPDLKRVEYVFHGTTAVINTLLERKGAVVGLMTTNGFRDIYEIGRGSRSEPFNMLFSRTMPLIPRSLRVEVCERIAGDGAVLEPLDEDSVLSAAETLLARGVDSIAICLLNSYLNPVHEKRIVAVLRERFPDVSVSASYQLAREWREYERTSTVAMDAYVKPKMHHYIRNLELFLRSVGFDGDLQILQSNGGSTSPGIALEQPLSLVESGPSAGIVGAAVLGRELGLEKLVSFDMGGTTAKACLVEGYKPKTTRPYYVGGRDGLPSLLPVVDIIEVGAGGGSIAFLDPGGALKVGPASAGADPGPVAYGRGGSEPTITDAHVLLGRISPTNFLGGELVLDVDAARKAISTNLAEPLGMSVEDTARGIIDIANNRMAMMLRQVSLERGHDPRELTLVATGGAGPLHATDIARELGIPRVVIPVRPAHFSAFGMLMSDVRLDSVRTLARLLDELAVANIQQAVKELEEEIRSIADRESEDASRFGLAFVLELCYEGQEHPLQIPFDKNELSAHALAVVEKDFHRAHCEFYGFSVPGEPIRILSVRVEATIELPKPRMAFPSNLVHGAHDDLGSRNMVVAGERRDVPVFARDRMELGAEVTGPALIEEEASTILLGPGDEALVDELGSLTIEVKLSDR